MCVMTESLPLHLIKRDGAVRDFDAEKIVQAVVKAGLATQNSMLHERVRLFRHMCCLVS